MKWSARLASLSGLAASVVIVVAVNLSGTDRVFPTDPSSLIAKALGESREGTRMGAQLMLLGGFSCCGSRAICIAIFAKRKKLLDGRRPSYSEVVLFS